MYRRDFRNEKNTLDNYLMSRLFIYVGVYYPVCDLCVDRDGSSVREARLLTRHAEDVRKRQRVYARGLVQRVR